MDTEFGNCRHCGQVIGKDITNHWYADDEQGRSYLCADSTDDARFMAGAHEPETADDKARRTGLSPLVDHILREGERQAAWLARSVDRDYKRTIAELNARLTLITEAVYYAYDGDYAPSERIVLRALQPSESAVRERMATDGWTEDEED